MSIWRSILVLRLLFFQNMDLQNSKIDFFLKFGLSLREMQMSYSFQIVFVISTKSSDTISLVEYARQIFPMQVKVMAKINVDNRRADKQSNNTKTVCTRIGEFKTRLHSNDTEIHNFIQFERRAFYNQQVHFWLIICLLRAILMSYIGNSFCIEQPR